MLRRRCRIVVGCMILAAGCTHSDQRQAQNDPSTQSAGESHVVAAGDESSPKSIQDLDAEVLQATLEDLKSYDGKDSPGLFNVRASEPVPFSSEPNRFPQTVDQVLFRYRDELWEALSEQDESLAKEAAGHLIERIETREEFGSFPVPAGYKVQKPDEAKDNPRAERAVSAWAPGFSADRKFAVVRLIIPWSIHHGEGTYLLSQQGGNWNVRLRQFVYYP
jgi:hypothetical protein